MTENKVITYNNVLNPLDRTILASGEYKNIDEILKELKYDNEIYDLVISKNSVIQSGFFELENGDVVNIAIVPKGGGGGGKKILGIDSYRCTLCGCGHVRNRHRRNGSYGRWAWNVRASRGYRYGWQFAIKCYYA